MNGKINFACTARLETSARAVQAFEIFCKLVPGSAPVDYELEHLSLCMNRFLYCLYTVGKHVNLENSWVVLSTVATGPLLAVMRTVRGN